MKKTLLTTMMISGVILGFGTMTKVSAANTDTSKDTTASATFTAGEDPAAPGAALALKSVTNEIDFGSNAISANGSIYTSDKAINVDVSDLRGTFTGWNVVVSGAPLMSDAATPTELKGATLTFPDATVQSEDINSDAANGVEALGTSNVLDGGAKISAPVDKGTGEIITNYDQSGITLGVIGGSARAAKYSTTLTWTLTDGPTA